MCVFMCLVLWCVRMCTQRPEVLDCSPPLVIDTETEVHGFGAMPTGQAASGTPGQVAPEC